MKNLINYLNDHPKKHLIFDLDDTITSLHIDWSTLRRQMRALVNQIDSSLAHMVPDQPGATDALHNLAIKTHGSKAKKLITSLLSTYECTHFSGHTPNQPLIDFIFNHQQTYQISIWTSNTHEVVWPVVQELKLDSILHRLITANQVDHKKPEPDGFHLIHQASPLKLNDYLMIGDSDRDKQAAQAASIDFIRVINQY